MMKRNLLVLLTFIVSTMTVWAQEPATIGSIQYNSTGGYYEISSTDNLNDLAVYVNGSGSYTTGGTETTAHSCPNVEFKMTANIPTASDMTNGIKAVTTIVGVSGHPFGGRFDGQGHTLTVNISGSGAQAPFGIISGATIKNLTVEGSVTGDNHSAGLVAASSNTGEPNTITDCTVLTNVSGGAYMGGIVGHGGAGTLTIQNSVFGGTVSGFTSYAGGLLGWCDALTLTISNCLMKGTMTPGSGGKFHPIACKNGSSAVTATVNDAYYLNHLVPTATGNVIFTDGTAASRTYAAGEYTFPVTAADDYTYYIRAQGSTTLTHNNAEYSVNIPLSGTQTLIVDGTIPEFKVHDHGGWQGYSPSCHGILELTAPKGYVFQLSGNITTYASGDALTVKNSDGTYLLYEVHSATDKTKTDIPTVTTSGNTMKLTFQSYYDHYCTHTLDLTVRLVLQDLQIDEYSSQGEDDYYYVNMPYHDTKTVEIHHAAINTFKVYDDGGKGGIGGSENSEDGNYSSSNYESFLVMTAPKGYVFQLSGTIMSSPGEDYLSVYDGGSDQAPTLINQVSSSDYEVATTIPTVVSTGRQMTLSFFSDEYYSYDGLDLTVKLLPSVSLADNADNSQTLTDYAGTLASVTLTGRTLLKTGEWNTLCLPFTLSDALIATSPLSGATIKELDTAAGATSLDDGTLTLKFKVATSIEAGKPYIVKWAGGDNIVNPVFNGVTITSTAPASNIVSNDGKVKFVGQYSPFKVGDTNSGDDGNLNELILLSTGNKLGYSTSARTLKCFRAHFYVPAGNGELSARNIVVDFFDEQSGKAERGDGETTEIATTDFTDYTDKAGAWYTLDGRKVRSALPLGSAKNGQWSLVNGQLKKGLYIVNGKKVVIK